ncbi:uncharacterized protein LOC101237943 [Hydra vulgaris]|uniref:uncharacterized protein LOC101237943 n=1 Tax=Hydra vulgaris TaxID=6087 RepID=UPI0032EA35FC
MKKMDLQKTYPNRRRKSSPSVQEKFYDISYKEEDFQKIFIDNVIGYGVFTKKEFKAGDALLEYKGETISRNEAKLRSQKYAMQNKGCFIFDLYLNNKKMSIDATDSQCLGRYINDAPEKFSNCMPKTCIIDGKECLMLFAKKYIPKDTELRYNYGDGSNQCWRKNKKYLQPFTIDDIKAYLHGKDLQRKVFITPSMVFASQGCEFKKVSKKKEFSSSLTSSNECKETFKDFNASSAASQVVSSEAHILNLTSSNEIQETFVDLVAGPALQVISSDAQILNLTSSNEIQETFVDLVAGPALQVISSDAQILNLTSCDEFQETFVDFIASPAALQVISSEAQILNLISSNEFQETFGDLVASPALQVISSEAQLLNLTSCDEFQETFVDFIASPTALQVISSEAQILNLTSSNEFQETFGDLVASPSMLP